MASLRWSYGGWYDRGQDTEKYAGREQHCGQCIRHKPNELRVDDMSSRRTIKGTSARSCQPSGPQIQVELSLRSEVSAISRFVDTLMRLIRKCRWVPGGEKDIEIALREALANAVIHGNHEDPEKNVYIGCRGGTDEISIVIRDEGQGFDIGEVPDPTAPENIESSHGRGIYLMTALMDEVRFEQGGSVVYMRKSLAKPFTLRKLR
jgi:serine/threonine-protein kinase RsbW